MKIEKIEIISEQEMFTLEQVNESIRLARLREHIMGLFIYEPEQIVQQIKSEKK